MKKKINQTAKCQGKRQIQNSTNNQRETQTQRKKEGTGTVVKTERLICYGCKQMWKSVHTPKTAEKRLVEGPKVYR